MVAAANAHVRLAAAPDDRHGAEEHPTDAERARDSLIHLEIAEAILARDLERVEALRAECRAYATCDTADWLNCERVYLEYRAKHGEGPLYRDWKTHGRGDPSWGTIAWKLPNDARVAVLADWGTAADDAAALLEDALDRGAQAVLHLGDVYYAGTPAECEAVRLQIREVFRNKGRSVPVFMTPGNHDYYAGGTGFYPMLDKLNEHLPNAAECRQRASFFCLRTEDDRWQFLAMDSGQDDCDPMNAENPRVAGPRLRESEVAWHHEKLKGFEGRSILLSHHQLYSANANINGAVSNQKPIWLNNSLHDAFAPFFADRIWAWLWGHEHNLVFYQDGFLGLNKGRLVGCGGYEETSGETPYTVNHPEVPYLMDPGTGRPMQLGVVDDYYNHGYAMIDLGTERIEYYQLPSWSGTSRKTLPRSQKPLVYSERLTPPAANMLAHVPRGMKTGHTGRWDGSPTGTIPWINLNRLGGSPAVKALSDSELHIAGPYNFLDPFRQTGEIDIRIWGVGTSRTCKLRVKVSGGLATKYLGTKTFDTGEVSVQQATKRDGSLTYSGGGKTLRQSAFRSDAVWYPGIELDFSDGHGGSLHLCFEDEQIK